MMPASNTCTTGKAPLLGKSVLSFLLLLTTVCSFAQNAPPNDGNAARGLPGFPTWPFLGANNPNAKKVAILVFPGVQIIDFAGPFEVFGQARYNVFTVAEKPDAFVSGFGLIMKPDYTFANCPKPDIIVTPGGTVGVEMPKDEPRVKWVLEHEKEAQYVMSVCNGAFILANAGLLDGKNSVTFWGLLADLKTHFPKTTVLRNQRFTDNGHIMSTAGLSSGIDGALHMVEKIDGHEKAVRVARNMEYNWRPQDGYARGALADYYLISAIGRQGFELPKEAVLDEVVDTGDTKGWEYELHIANTSLTLESLTEIVNRDIGKAWTKVSSDGTKSTWSFKGDDGKPWEGESVVETDAGDKSKLVLKVKYHEAS